MKIAVYRTLDNKDLEVKYDENAPCRICGLPVEHASMGGTDVCPSCDCGRYRDGTEINVRELLRPELLKKKAKEIYEKIQKGGDINEENNNSVDDYIGDDCIGWL